jgi:hypothetical protein
MVAKKPGTGVKNKALYKRLRNLGVSAKESARVANMSAKTPSKKASQRGCAASSYGDWKVPVLLAISSGDTRRQRELNAGQHLLDCETCAMLSEPLDRRCIALTGIAAPGGMLGWLLKRARAHPAHAAAVTATATAATVAAAVLVSKAAPSPARPPASFPAGCFSQGHEPSDDRRAGPSLRRGSGIRSVPSSASRPAPSG